MDEVEIENSTNPENPENDQPQKAKYAIQVKNNSKPFGLSLIGHQLNSGRSERTGTYVYN